MSGAKHGGKYAVSPQKAGQKIKNMALFRRPSCKRQNSIQLIKRYCRLIK